MKSQNNRQTSGTSSIKVLMYHRVAPDGDLRPGYFWSVTQSQLRRHLELLQRWGFTCISFEDHALSLKGELLLPKKPVILTFDDGYDDVYNYALPVLKDFGVRATIFTIGDRSIKTNRWDYPERAARTPLLNDDMVVELHKLGFEIGSHSLTHADLTKISEKEAWEEIAGSKKILEDLVKSPVISFAYPFGSTNEHLGQLVKSAGYSYGCASYSGPPRFSTDLFSIRRTQLTNASNFLDFAIKMLTPYGHYRWLWWKTRRRFLRGRRRARTRKTYQQTAAHEGVSENAKE